MLVLDDTTIRFGDQNSSDAISTSDECFDVAATRPVVVKPHPFSQSHEVVRVPSGARIDEILESIEWKEKRHIGCTVVKIDGVPVPEEQWEWLAPAADQHVTVMAIPHGGGGGGGKSIGKIFLGIALIAASFFVPEAGLFGLGIVTSSAVAGIGFSMTLGGLAGLLAPTPNLPKAVAPSFNSEPQKLVNSITGTQNRANPFGAVPRVFGTHRLFPPLAASPFTEIVGNDQYLVMLFCFGYGRVDVSGERIGETDLANFSDVQGLVHEGTTATPTLSYYTNDVFEDRFDILLTNVGGWQTRTTTINVEQIAVDFTYPRGVVAFDSQGSRVNTTVSVDVQYRASGSADPWTSAGTVTVTDNTSSIVRRTLKFSVTQGQYDVRCQRTTADPGTNVYNEVHWSILRSFKMTSPINTSKKFAFKEMRIRATNQLNGVIDQYSAVVKSYLQVYDGAAWSSAITNNPAWAYVSVLTDEANANALALSRINASDMKSWADWCDTNGFTYNRVIDTKTTVFDLLQEIASAGRATYHIQDGLYTVVRDISQSTPIQHFSQRNVIEYSGERLIKTSPHALRIPFLNEDIDYAQDERIVYDDGYDENNATDFESLEFRGVTNKDQIWKLGRYHIAQARLRRESHTVTTDIEFLECTRGDLVVFVHDVVKFGLGAARITQVDLDGANNATGVHFDEKWIHEAQKSYAVRIRKSDGTSLLENVDTVAGENVSVTFSTAIPAANPQPEVGDLMLFGEQGSESVKLLVSSIRPRADLTAQLKLVNEAPGVLTADSGTIPDFTTNITQPGKLANMTPPVPILGTIRSDETVLVRDVDGSLRSQMAVPFEFPSNTSFSGDVFVQVQYRISGSNGPWTIAPLVPATQNEVVIGNVEDGETYELRARATNGRGLASAFTSSVLHTVVGKSNPPPDVDTFMVDRQSDGTREFSWTLNNPPLDLAGYKIRYKLGTGHAWADMTDLHSGLLQASPFETNQLAAGTYTIGIKAVDTSGNESTNAKIIQSTIGDPRLAGALLQVNCRGAGWPGTKTNCFVDSDGALIADTQDTWNDWVNWSAETIWLPVPFTPITYEHTKIDLGAELTYTLLVNVTSNSNPTVTESHSSDDITYTPFAAISGQITARYQKVKVQLAQVGTEIPKFDNVIIIPDASALVEDQSDVDTSTLSGSTGDRRLSLVKSFSVITSVTIALQNVGSGWTWEVIDKDVALGPRIKIYDNGVLSDATIDVVIRGVA